MTNRREFLSTAAALTTLTLGRQLNWNPQAEQFVNDPEANKLLSREPCAAWNI